MGTTPAEQPRPQRINISAQDLADIIRNELYGLQRRVGHGGDLPNELVKETAQNIVRTALMSNTDLSADHR